MNSKIKWLRDKIRLSNMDGIIISNPVNIKYLTGINAEGTLLVTRKENYYITDSRYIEYAKSVITINDGIINNRKIKIKYMDSQGNITERKIHPYGLYTYYGSNYFIGKCEERYALRQFKLVRIKEIQLLKEKFEKDNFNLSDYLKNTIGIFKDKSYKVKLKITYPYAMGFKEYSWTEDEEIEDYIEEGYIIYNATVEGKTEIIPWIMGMGTACTVLEPLELKKDIIKAYKDVLNNYK